MKIRRFGNSGLEVSAIGFGCMGTSFSYGPPKDKEEMKSLLRTVVERGVTFFSRPLKHPAHLVMKILWVKPSLLFVGRW